MAISTLLKTFCISAMALTTATALINNYDGNSEYNPEQEVCLTDNLLKMNEFEEFKLENNVYSDLIKYDEQYQYSSDEMTKKYWNSAMNFNSEDEYTFYISFGKEPLKYVNNYFYYGFKILDGNLQTLTYVDSGMTKTQNGCFSFKFSDSLLSKINRYDCFYIRPFIEYNTVCSKHKGAFAALENENAKIRFALQNTSKTNSFSLDDVTNLNENSLNQYATLEELYSFIEDDEITEEKKEEIKEILKDFEKENQKNFTTKIILIPMISLSLTFCLFLLFKKNKKC